MATEFRLDRYLARIDVSGPVAPDLATLASIHAAHADAIPFEGLDPFLGRPVNLDLTSLQDKLVDSRRGGFCFEQNALFKAALEAIGFTVTGLGGRVRWMSPPDAPLGGRTHMLLKVDLPEGPYIADVGFGGCVLDAPLRFQTDTEQSTAMGTFRLSDTDGQFAVSAKQPAGWRTQYVFTLEPQIQSDYELGSWYASTNPRALFPSALMLERVTGGKRYKLVNRRFTIEARDGQVADQRTIRSAGELRQILDETFKLTPPVPVEDIFARLGG